MRTLFANAHIVTMDEAGRRSRTAGFSRTTASSRRSGADNPPPAEAYENLAGSLVTPGLVNTHHHLFQTLTGHARNRPTCSRG